VSEERVVRFSVRSVLTVIALVIAAWAMLSILAITRQVISWVLVSIFLALALNPAVDWFMRHGLKRRSAAAAVTYILAIGAIIGLGFLFIPTLVHQVNDLIQALPGYVDDLTKGRGRLGFLQTKYHIVDKIREGVSSGGASKVLGLTGTAISITKSIVSLVLAIITITFLTFFMLLEGPAWMDRIYGLMPERSQERWRRVGYDIYRTVGGYVTGNLLISLIAGTLTTAILLALGVPFAVALGVIVAVLDLIPLAGATIAAIIIGTVAFLHSITAGIIVVIFFIVYQQIENGVLYPWIMARKVNVNPLGILLSVLLAVEVFGMLGALLAVPVSGALQVIVTAVRQERQREHLVLPDHFVPGVGVPQHESSSS
jgi:predicted PurR-regulated permease PerM